jgi:hypothetical protein
VFWFETPKAFRVAVEPGLDARRQRRLETLAVSAAWTPATPARANAASPTSNALMILPSNGAVSR